MLINNKLNLLFQCRSHTSTNFLKLNINLNTSNFSIFSSKLYKRQYNPFATKIKIDPYFLLDLHRGAEFKDIKKSYFKLARQYHPDLNKNDEVI